LVRLASNMGASHAEIRALERKQAEKKASKSLPALADSAAAMTTKAKPKKAGWQAPQDAATRAKALTAESALPPPPGLERCWECLPDLPPAGAWDWLGKGQAGERDRAGQTLKRFLQPGPHRTFPTRQAHKIYLLPLGDVSGAPSTSVLQELIRLWFLLEVEVLPPPKKKWLATIERNAQGCGYGAQIECPSAAKLLHSLKPKDAFIMVGYTMEDICDTAKGFQFLFGQAHSDLGVGVFSFARYTDDIERSSSRFLRRCGMVLCHEALHLFGVKHCVYASCVMNGSNHLEESENRPFTLCPVDLRKLQLTLDQAKLQGRETPPVDLVGRERALASFFHSHGLLEDARTSRALVSALTGQPEPEPETVEQS